MVWSLKEALERTWDLPLNDLYGNPVGKARWKYYGMKKDKHNPDDTRQERTVFRWRIGEQLEDE